MQNRIIKFRVWDNVDYMSAPFTLNDVVRRQIEFTSDVIILQWTGLKDKNGIEIYEGDIVKHLAPNAKFDSLDDNSPIEIEVNSAVEYKDHGFWLSQEFFGWEGEGLANWDNIEVIGNIYSNPELLNQK